MFHGDDPDLFRRARRRLRNGRSNGLQAGPTGFASQMTLSMSTKPNGIAKVKSISRYYIRLRMLIDHPVRKTDGLSRRRRLHLWRHQALNDARASQILLPELNYQRTKGVRIPMLLPSLPSARLRAKTLKNTAPFNSNCH